MMRLLVLSLLLPALTLVCSPALAARTEQSLDTGWKFDREDVAGASEKTFDDAAWSAVNLPHTWNAQDATGGGGNYYRGIGWYRRHIDITADQLGKSVCLWFGAAGSQAEVFVNGQSAGSHKGAFAAFCYDVTKLLQAGDNVVAVKVSNARDPDIAPLSGDFNVFGGLYRQVKLITLEPLHVSPLDSGSSGVYVKQVKVTDESAELEITTKLRSISASNTQATVKATVTDASGVAVGTASAQDAISPGQTHDVVSTIAINRPHLWNAKSDPYQYNVIVEVSQGTNASTDKLTIPIGMRYFKVDPKQGFVLNGKPYDLHGVNRHQDFGKLGWAITPREMQIDMDLIKELGCTMIRCAHYQHDQAFYDLCDKNGLVVWAELSQVNQLGASQAFGDISRQQLTELIKQNFNHPSICFWSLYNEVNWAGGERDLALLRSENDLAHQLDPTRLTTAASNRRVETPAHWIPDVIGFNVYYGWYADQTPPDWKGGLDGILAFHPDRAVGISEYGAGGSILHHEIPPRRPPTVSRWHPEEYQAALHEQGWKEMSGRPLWCRLIWVFADFPVNGRREGDTLGFNDKGLVTNDRQTKKDVFYFYKANWSDEPFVYITSRRFTPRPTDTTQVKIYTNCDSAELKVNGQSLGSKSSPDHILIWDNVPLKRGANQFEATGSKAGQPYHDSCTIEQDPSATTKPSA
jgi:beta-galactosidase